MTQLEGTLPLSYFSKSLTNPHATHGRRTVYYCPLPLSCLPSRVQFSNIIIYIIHLELFCSPLGVSAAFSPAFATEKSICTPRFASSKGRFYGKRREFHTPRRPLYRVLMGCCQTSTASRFPSRSWSVSQLRLRSTTRWSISGTSFCLTEARPSRTNYTLGVGREEGQGRRGGLYTSARGFLLNVNG